MFNALIPLLADRYHLVAPDYPGFGHSDAPALDAFTYSFDHLAEVMEQLAQALGLARYVLFVQDYGGPVGFRLALAHRGVRAIIVQNAVSMRKASARSGRHGRPIGRTAAATKRNCARI